MIELCSRFPSIGLRLPFSREVSLLGFEPGRYAAMALLSGFGAVALSFLFFGGAAALVAAGSCACFFCALPALEKGHKAREIESELPLFLRSLGMLLDFGLPLERSLEVAAEGRGALGAEVRLWLKEMGDGLGFRRALSVMATQYSSVGLKRALSSLILSLESGGRGSEIRKIGDDLLALEQHRMREYAAKSAVFGLVLIVVSAILPTFYLIYAVSGMAEAEEGGIRIAMLVLFPMLSMLAIMISRSMMPRITFPGSGFSVLPLIPGALAVSGYALMPSLKAPFFALGAALGAYIIWKNFGQERRNEEIEGNLPDALLLAGAMPDSAGPGTLFSMIEGGDFGALSEEAAKSRKQLQSNVPLGAVLDDLWRRNRSGMLQRGCTMLRQMMDSGSLRRIGVLADDMIRHAQLRRERAAAFATQKYTLLAGAALIPLIMKMALGLLALSAEAGAGGASAGTAASLVPPYIVIYSSIASAAIGDYEGKKSSAVIYLVLMASLGLALFHFISF